MTAMNVSPQILFPEAIGTVFSGGSSSVGNVGYEPRNGPVRFSTAGSAFGRVGLTVVVTG